MSSVLPATDESSAVRHVRREKCIDRASYIIDQLLTELRARGGKHFQSRRFSLNLTRRFFIFIIPFPGRIVIPRIMRTAKKCIYKLKVYRFSTLSSEVCSNRNG